ncbi:MAG TPA: glycerol-3-phosphate transporter permease, partial [Xanthobacteraceae bacterium]|nr:glycerol-3-phosphate transporter permease [Xanthobacteraceae bacterium]
MQTKRVTFAGYGLPALLVAPQLAVTLVFFIWPASQALYQSVLQEDPFGLKREFVGLANFRRLFSDPAYLDSFAITAAFSLAVA